MKAVVVIPTYNEAGNIGRLIPRIFEETRTYTRHDFHILVVDGNSPDGTADIVNDIGKENPNVHLLLEKEKAGLGAAYILAFRYALNVLNAEILVEMDADFQHDPANLPELIKGIDDGYDYVIGSRYIHGGSIPKEWAFYRKFLSIGGNLFSKIVLGIYDVNDFTTGYKATRVKGFLDKMDLDRINSSGFAYKMDLLYRMHIAGAKIKQIPITFGLRDRGNSKMERDNALDSLRVVFLIKSEHSKNKVLKWIFTGLFSLSTFAMVFLSRPENKSFIKFAIVGFVGLFTDGTAFNILRLTPLGTVLSAPISGLIAMITTFMLNNRWSFGDRKLEGTSKKAASFAFYIASSTVPILVRTWMVTHAVTNFGDTFLVSNIAFLLGVIFGLFWNYTIYSNLIWRKNV